MRLCKLAFLLAALACLFAATEANNVTQRSGRVKRFLGLFNVIQFANLACNATADSTVTGTCYTSTECAQLGGRAGGVCAAGFGVCCVFEYDCTTAKSASQDVIYFRSRGYPQPQSQPDMCLFSVTVANPDVCQIRLDFIDFELDPGSSQTSPCDRDSLEVLTSGVSNLGMGRLCGHNQGQHLYIPVEGETAQPMLRLLAGPRESTFVSNNITRDFMFNIKLTQIDCVKGDAMQRMLRAPDDCLQYYTDRSGTFSSFNWSPGSQVVYSKNQNYAICFRRGSGDCQLHLVRSASAPAMSTSVGMASYTQGTGNGLCGSENGCRTQDCIRTSTNNPAIPANSIVFDHLQINGFYRDNTNQQPNTVSQYIRGSVFCGIGLGRDLTTGTGNTNVDGLDDRDGVIVQSNGPFIIRFITDNYIETAPATTNAATTPYELGFSLDYNIAGCVDIDEKSIQ